MEDPRTKYDDNYNPMRYENEKDLEQLPLSARSNSSKQSRFHMSEMEAMPIGESEPMNYGASDDEAPLSARSRFTTASNVTTITSKSKRREHKLGCEYTYHLNLFLKKAPQNFVSNSQYIARYESNYFITKHILAKFRSPYFCC